MLLASDWENFLKKFVSRLKKKIGMEKQFKWKIWRIFCMENFNIYENVIGKEFKIENSSKFR